jgi:short-subunit dehydrogenase
LDRYVPDCDPINEGFMSVKRVVVTGGSDGIGLAIAAAFAASGSSVFTVARDSKKLAAVREKMQAAGSEVHFTAADLASPQGVRDASDAILRTWSELDVLVNNVGVAVFCPSTKRQRQCSICI